MVRRLLWRSMKLGFKASKLTFKTGRFAGRVGAKQYKKKKAKEARK